ncbi:MAG: lysophospholipid acyltransferase family protein [Bacteroidota bacterium]|nr:lysophospholipid acyltransferase family protein [Bacteroidota bacterium]
MKIFTILYSFYGLLVFSSLFIFFSIPLLLGIWFKPLKKMAYWAHHKIARTFFSLIFIPMKIRYEKGVDLKKQYVIIANHFSFIDIPALAALNIPFKFIGKMQVNNIPVLGYIFKNLHIMVDRDSKESRKQTYIDSFNSIDQGYSIGIFPEGGIKTEKVPTMAPFKNGAFAMALEKQVPILPVSLLGAYKIMKGSFFINWSPCEIVCHKPIYTDGYSSKDVDAFKEKCYNILQSELDKSYNE